MARLLIEALPYIFPIIIGINGIIMIASEIFFKSDDKEDKENGQ